MKKTNLIYLFTLLAVGLFVTSCSDDDDDHDHDHDHNEITITIDEPIDGETIMDCSEVHIHIDFEASEENHEIEVVLHPEGNVDDKIIDYDEHTHDQVVHFEQEVDLCGYEPGTCFHLEVAACTDHDCEEKATAEVEFCIQ